MRGHLVIMAILGLQLQDLLHQQFVLDPVTEQRRPLRVEVYEPVNPEHRYVIGSDTAYGLIGRDADTACVMDKDTAPVRQVAEIEGHVGELWDQVIYAAIKYWDDAFLVMERQAGGLFTLARLWEQYGVRWMYMNRDRQAVAAAKQDARQLLGHHRVNDDVVLREFQRAVMVGDCDLYSERLIEQMGRTEYREPRSRFSDERREDRELKIKLKGGGSPDLVMAASYAWLGISEMGHYPRPERKPYADGTLGALLGHNELLQGQKPGGEDFVWSHNHQE